MVNPCSRTGVPVVLWFLALAGVASPADGDPFQTGAMATLQGEAALRDRLGSRILLVTVTPKPLPFQDPGFLTRRLGLGVRTFHGGKPVVMTSLTLVEESGGIEIVRPVSRRSVPARVTQRLEKEGLAILDCLPEDGAGRGPGDGDGPCSSPPVPLGVMVGESGQPLYFVLPADGDRLVVSSTRVEGTADPTMEGLVVVKGRIPFGTPLFDLEGAVVALVIRPAADLPSRSLAAVLAPAKTGAVESNGK